jgi:hypothetical protein
LEVRLPFSDTLSEEGTNNVISFGGWKGACGSLRFLVSENSHLTKREPRRSEVLQSPWKLWTSGDHRGPFNGRRGGAGVALTISGCFTNMHAVKQSAIRIEVKLCQQSTCLVGKVAVSPLVGTRSKMATAAQQVWPVNASRAQEVVKGLRQSSCSR